jgi:hypothetical protein
MDLVQEPERNERFRGLHTLDDRMVCEALRHGIYNDQSALRSLMQFYYDVFLKASVDRRRAIYSHVPMIVSEIGGWAAGAMTPFMLLDRNPAIVSTATIDYASLGSLANGDPMTRPKDAINMVRLKVPDNPAAVFGGLLALADPRVCRLLAPLRATLNPQQVATVTHCFSGVTAKCMVEFYLDWLDELVDRQEETGLNIFGNVVAGLYRLADSRSVPVIMDGLRPFPVPQDVETGWPDVIQIDPAAHAVSISSRLYELERREGMPRVMPHAMRAFGITPKSKPEEIALMQ